MKLFRYTRFAVRGIVKQAVKTSLYVAIGGGAVLIFFGVRHLENRPDLSVWHTEKLKQEFTKDSDINSFNAYMELEERLFEELDKKVYARIAPEEKRPLNRYHKNSLADPGTWRTNWNRSFEFATSLPRAGVLLLHGLSDSPYSLRDMGIRLHESGAWVVGLRIPGHGTAPSGLIRTDWQDMAASVDLAFRHLAEQVQNAPLYIVGYSNGGALAVEYTLRSVLDAALPKPERLVLLSPEIGISKLAALAVWQERLGHLLGLEKLGWQTILPEIEAFKYGSFALNAAKQAYLLTNEVQNQITALGTQGVLEQIPPILAFQSVVDATVSAPALVAGLFARLPEGGHELVLYDFNRHQDKDLILASDPSAWVEEKLSDQDNPFALTVITNRDEQDRRVKVSTLQTERDNITECQIEAAWPEGIYSLSHVALPFAGDDPLYGVERTVESPRLQLGNLALRGERGVLQIPESSLLRLRWNPFYSFQLQRILHFLDLAQEIEC